MNPLPSWVAVLSIIASILGAADAATLHLLPTWAGLTIVAAGAIAAFISKSITTNGLPVGMGIVSLIVAAVGAVCAVTYPDPKCTPTPETACATVQLITLLPPIWGKFLALLGTLGAAISDAEHPKTGLVVGTATVTGNG